MRFRLLLLPLLPLGLGACTKDDAPVRLDFVGAPGLVSGNQTATANDTLVARAYAVGLDNDLTHLRITVRYEPTRNPILYPTPLANYDPRKAPSDEELVYLDSTLALQPSRTNPLGRELLFQNRFGARASSGTELWRYTITDASGASASRAYRLTVRRPDSLVVFHSYTSALKPVRQGVVISDTLRDRARVFLNLRSGLLLPKYAVLNKQNTLQANQQLIDLVCTAQANSISLQSPARFPQLTGGQQRRTRLLRTSLTPAAFAQADTAANFARAYRTGVPFAADSLGTGPLVNGSVLVFRTTEGFTGLLLVTNLTTGTAPVLTCSVRVQKQ